MKKFLGLFLAVAFITTISVMPALAAKVDFSGEVRVRHEIYNNYDFTETDSQTETGLAGSAQDSNNKTLQRTRINAKINIDDQTTGFISLQDSRTWGSSANTATTGNDVEAIDLSQGWLNIKLFGPISMKLGRQPISYGNQRVLGGFEWSNNARRHDGAKFSLKTEAVDADLFFTELRENGAGAGDDQLNGLYVTLKMIRSEEHTSELQSH